MASNTHFSKGRKEPIRLGVFTVDLIFDFIKANQYAKYYITNDGDTCKLRRARIFLRKGISCVTENCNLTGQFFALELWPDGGGLHFDLFAIDKEGNEVLMTVDHRHPKSLGGKNSIKNYDTMCKYHNDEKADHVEIKEDGI